MEGTPCSSLKLIQSAIRIALKTEYLLRVCGIPVSSQSPEMLLTLKSYNEMARSVKKIIASHQATIGSDSCRGVANIRDTSQPIIICSLL